MTVATATGEPHTGAEHPTHACSADSPLISVVTPSFNQGRFLARCIESVRAQRYPNFEHIVQDNCSTDETLAVLRSFPHVRWTAAPDTGQSDALNRAIQQTRGEIIAWLNADDYYLPGTFQLAARELRRSTGVHVIAGQVQMVDDAGRTCGIVTPRFERPDDLLDFWSRPYGLCQPGVLFRREVLDRVGPFRTDLHFAMDYDFWLRVAQHFPIRIVDAQIAAYVVHAASKTGQGRSSMRFWDELEHISRSYWGPLLSRRRRQLARACRPYAARQLACVWVDTFKRTGAVDWALLGRLLCRAPRRVLSRPVLAIIVAALSGAKERR